MVSIRSTLIATIAICSSVSGLSTLSCVSTSRYPRVSFENAPLRERLEKEFSDRALDPIEGFWKSSNEYLDGTCVIYNCTPETNDGFMFACRVLTLRQTVLLPHRLGDLGRIVGRLKHTAEPGVYVGQALMTRGTHEFWENVTVKLLDPTTAQTTVHSDGPVLGGKTQLAYFVGPSNELMRRTEAVAKLAGRTKLPGTRTHGSGFAVSRRHVVTNHHVIESASEVHWIAGDIKLPCIIRAVDPVNDLALLEIEQGLPPGILALPLRTSSAVKHGQQIFALGYPQPDLLGKDVRINEGIVSSVTGEGGGVSQFQLEMNTMPGNSGGPLLDASGCVVGVIRSKLSGKYAYVTGDIPSGVTFAIKSEVARPLLHDVDVKWESSAVVSGEPVLSAEEISRLCRGSIVLIESQH